MNTGGRSTKFMDPKEINEYHQDILKMTKKDIPLRDRIILGPIDKYIIYDRFPWKFVMHILLILFTTLQVLYIFNTMTFYSGNQNATWEQLFLGGTDLDEDGPYQIFTVDDLTIFMQQTVDQYYEIGSDDQLNYYTPQTQDNGIIQPVELQIFPFDLDNQYDDSLETYYLTPDSIYPFGITSQNSKDIINHMSSMSLTFVIGIEMPEEAKISSGCLTWTIIQKYDFLNRGYISVTLDTQVVTCDTFTENLSFYERDSWIHLSVVLLSFAMLVNNITYLRKIQDMFNKFREKYEQKFMKKMTRDLQTLDTQINDLRKKTPYYESYVNIFKENKEFQKGINSSFASGEYEQYTINQDGKVEQQQLQRQKANIRSNSLKSDDSLNFMKESTDTFGNKTDKSRPTSNKQSEDQKYTPTSVIKEKEEEYAESAKNSASRGRRSSGGESSSSGTSFVSSFDTDSLSDFSDLDLQQDQLSEVENLLRQNKMSWEELDIFEKSKLIDKTVFLIIASNLFSGFGTIFYTTSPIFTMKIAQLFCGLGCFFAWATVARYFRNTESYTMISKTFDFSITLVLQVMIGVLPFMIGFVFLGISLFHQSIRFDSFSNGAASLLCVMYGDDLFNFWTQVTEVNLFTGVVYSFVWIFMGFAIIQNIFLAVVTDTFDCIKYLDKMSWVKDEDEKGNADDSQESSRNASQDDKDDKKGKESQDGDNDSDDKSIKAQNKPSATGKVLGLFLQEDSKDKDATKTRRKSLIGDQSSDGSNSFRRLSKSLVTGDSFIKPQEETVEKDGTRTNRSSFTSAGEFKKPARPPVHIPSLSDPNLFKNLPTTLENNFPNTARNTKQTFLFKSDTLVSEDINDLVGESKDETKKIQAMSKAFKKKFIDLTSKATGKQQIPSEELFKVKNKITTDIDAYIAQLKEMKQSIQNAEN